MTPPEPQPIARFTVDALQVLVYEDRGQAGKASAQTLAALPPADSAARQAGPASDADIPRLLQTELKRVGCRTGA